MSNETIKSKVKAASDKQNFNDRIIMQSVRPATVSRIGRVARSIGFDIGVRSPRSGMSGTFDVYLGTDN